MSKIRQLTEVEFQELLKWFSPNENKAGEKYEQIHSGLKRYFRFRGCADPENLADLTINRVASKLSTLDLSTKVRKISIFYGFAFNIYREYLANDAKREVSLNLDFLFDKKFFSNGEENGVFICLENCLSKLSEEDKELVIQYYSEEKGAKIGLRREIADNLNITMNTLHVRIFRLKSILKDCIENCLKKKL